MADEELLLIPKVPATLREAAQLGTLIPFIGAGVSRLAGCPSWEQLAQESFLGFIKSGKFSHAQLDQIGDLAPRVKLSLAVALQEEFQVPIDFRKLVHPTERKDHVKGRRLYGLLSKIGKTFVTTNYDEWLDDELSEAPISLSDNVDAAVDAKLNARHVVYDPSELTALNLNRAGAVLHLHGSLKQPHESGGYDFFVIEYSDGTGADLSSAWANCVGDVVSY